MPDTTVPSAVIEKSAKKTAEKVADVLPAIVETTEVALEFPSKVVVNQKLLVAIGFFVGATVTAGGYFLGRKLEDIQAKRAEKKAKDELSETIEP
jgi:hypothetical protein